MYLIKMYQLFFLNLCIYDIIDITSCSPRHGNSAQSKILLWEWEIRGQKNKAVKKKKKQEESCSQWTGLYCSSFTRQASIWFDFDNQWPCISSGCFMVSYGCCIRCAVFTHNNKSIFFFLRVQIRKWLRQVIHLFLVGGQREFSPPIVSIHSIIIHTVMIGTSEW